MNQFNDQPIHKPEDDKFGFDTFAVAIAKSIIENRNPEGTVVAIHGPWGTGKSSIVNLIKHHLQPSVEAGDIEVLNFNCWWFKGEEALALEFFRQLYGVLDKSDLDTAKDAVSQLGSRLLGGTSTFVGAALNIFAAPGVGAAATSGMNLISDLIKQDKSIEAFHAEVSKALAESSKRHLIVIDDIDRLSPEEALMIFRLVKSIGRLPNVMYLLAYDREIADRIVSERFPSEGPQYLEKIVQAGFDIPNPPHSKLVAALIDVLNELWKDQDTPEATHFWNIFYDCVSPLIQSPRDLIRITNTVKVSWQAVAGEVDPVDFFALESLRVQKGSVYTALKANKRKLTDGGSNNSHENQDARASRYEDIFLRGLDDDEREGMKRALRRLFPALDGVWGNLYYSDDSYNEWEQKRRACSRKHFDTYFRFSLSDTTVSLSEIKAIIEHSGDANYVAEALKEARKSPRSDGQGSKAGLLLEELNAHAKEVPLADAVPFLSGIFTVHDELDTEEDAERGGFAIANNNLRIHWLVRALLWDRTSLPERSAIICEAAESASVGWLVDLAESAYRDFHPREGQNPEPEDRCLTTEEDAFALRQRALEKIQEAASDGSLLQYEYFPRVIFRWDELAGNEGHDLASSWCMEQLENDEAIVAIARAFTSESWVTGMGGFGAGLGDTVSVRHDRVSEENLNRFFELGALRARVEEVLAKSETNGAHYSVLKRFLDAWDNKENH